MRKVYDVTLLQQVCVCTSNMAAVTGDMVTEYVAVIPCRLYT